MSHMTTIKTQLSNLDHLRDAAVALGLTLEGQGTVRMYGSYQQPAEHVLRLPGPYDVGFTAQPDGSLTMVCDSEIMYDRDNGRNSNALKLLGPQCGRLFQEYAAVAATHTAMLQNYTTARQNQEDGSLVLVMTR